MTSPLRRKRPITVRSTRRETAARKSPRRTILAAVSIAVIGLTGFQLPSTSQAETPSTSPPRLLSDQTGTLQLRYADDGVQAASHTTPVTTGNPKLKWRAARPRQRETSVEPTLPPPMERLLVSRPAPRAAAGEEFIEAAPEPDALESAPRLTQPSSGLPPFELLALQPRGPDVNEPGRLGDPQSDIDEIPGPDGLLHDNPCAIDRLHRIDEINISIAVMDAELSLPIDCPIADRGQFQPRNWYGTDFHWKASGLCHKPLYFEQVALERYGHSWALPVQAVVSGAHFFATVPVLPYKMGVDPPWECKYALGYYRPGNCAPFMIPPVPISLRGALVQAGVVTGAVALFP